MIDQGEHVNLACKVSHASGFGGIHGHRFFAEHGLALLESGERDFHMRRGRRDDAYEIDIVARDQVFPIISDVFNAKLLSDTRCAFTMPAGNRHHLSALAVAKARNLRSPGKAGAYNTDADYFVITQFFHMLLQLSVQDL